MSANDTRAREEVALLVSRFSRIGHCGHCVVAEPDEIAGILTDPKRFARLAGLLGYVKADSEEWMAEGDRPCKWSSVTHPDRESAEKQAEMVRNHPGYELRDPTARVVRRHVTAWVVCDVPE